MFVNLDMEEYRDLELTVAAFQQVLDEAPFERLDAGIVLQAYLPDVHAVAGDLGEWAVRRRQRGGGRTKVRLVKGANLAMETVEAELRGWEPAPFGSKGDVDANYKAVLDVLADPSFDDAVDIGVGSHNLFDVAWALGVRDGDDRRRTAGPPRHRDARGHGALSVRGRARRRRRPRPLRTHRATRRLPAALAYLVRRLDENTAPANFLSQLFDLAADPTRFDRQAELFREAAVGRRHQLDHRPRRQQARPTLPEATPA